MAVIEWEHRAQTIDSITQAANLPSSYREAFAPSATSYMLIFVVALAAVAIGVGIAVGVRHNRVPTPPRKPTYEY